eukprot:g6528.t1
MAVNASGEMVPVHLTVAGKIDDPRYQECKDLAEAVSKLNKFTTYDLVPMVEADWLVYLAQKKTEFGGDAWSQKVSPMVFYNGCNYIGSAEEFVAFASRVFGYKTVPNSVLHNRKARVEYAGWIESNAHSFCFLDFESDGAAVGRVVIELFDDVCPKTCENFTGLCAGGAGSSSYVGTPIHRVVKGGWVQGGDTDGGRGNGGSSTFGATFEDESFEVLHD